MVIYMFTFSLYPSSCYHHVPELIMGRQEKTYFIDMDGLPYLIIKISNNTWNPFNTECLFKQFFCIGNGDEVYLINLHTKETKTILCDMYFGYFYIYNNKLYITSNDRLFCFNHNCDMLWQTEKIAIDGVIVNGFSEKSLLVSCETDPPGGWIQYQISIFNGKILSPR